MFFCGDVAVSGRYDNLEHRFDFADGQQALFLNLEGAMCTDEEAGLLLKRRKVFNTDKVIGLLRSNHVTGCILANNHITDHDDKGLTVRLLEGAGIKHTGYGSDCAAASEPLCFTENGTEYSMLAFGWDVAGCKAAKEDRRGVNILERENVLSQIRKERAKGKKVIVFFHWDYVDEMYPMPAQRELAKQGVDEGADLIVGCHAHCIQGVEYYHGVPIVYGLGNWMFDSGVYFNGRLKTRTGEADELVAEYRGGSLFCHWYRFDTERSVPVHVQSESAETSERVRVMTPYAGMDDRGYVKWFKKNRTMHKLTPVFASNDDRIRNKVYYLYLTGRAKVWRTAKDGIRCLRRTLST